MPIEKMPKGGKDDLNGHHKRRVASGDRRKCPKQRGL